MIDDPNPVAGDPEPKAALPYEPVALPEGWKEMEDWRTVETENGWTLIGSCARCKHPVDKYFPDHVQALALETVKKSAAKSEASPTLDSPNVVRCNCTANHPGRESSEQGCGAFWGIQIERARG